MNKKGLENVRGFEYSGIKISGKKNNMGIVYSTVENTIGKAVYTQNDIVAAPVIVSKEMDVLSDKKRAIIINSGTANAFTGKQGIIDAKSTIRELAHQLNIDESQCYIGSTGVIGEKMDMEHILSNIKRLVDIKDRRKSIDFIEAIMTTDTRIKQSSVECEINGKKVNIAACAKGAGMIMPNMATMLSVVVTDANISSDILDSALKEAIKSTLNCITVDGDTSTNDSVFLLANGLANNEKINKKDNNYFIFVEKLRELLEDIAKQIVNDGEGVTKFITLEVVNTVTYEQAKSIAFSVANSPLVKTALFGQSLNWGRLMMAIGKARTGIDCSKIDIWINDIQILKYGELIDTKSYDEAQESLKNRDINIKIDFNQGKEKIKVWTCDFSYDYVKINADYLS